MKRCVHFKQEGHASIVMEEAHFRHNIHASFQLTNLTFTVNRRVIFTHVPRWYAQSESIIIKTHSKTIVLPDYSFYLLVFFFFIAIHSPEV
jgi:hypothetical protein